VNLTLELVDRNKTKIPRCLWITGRLVLPEFKEFRPLQKNYRKRRISLLRRWVTCNRIILRYKYLWLLLIQWKQYQIFNLFQCKSLINIHEAMTSLGKVDRLRFREFLHGCFGVTDDIMLVSQRFNKLWFYITL